MGGYHLKYEESCTVLQKNLVEASTATNWLCQRLTYLSNISPFRDECWEKDLDNRIQTAIRFGKELSFVKAGDSIIIIHGWKKGPGFTNTFRLVYA